MKAKIWQIKPDCEWGIPPFTFRIYREGDNHRKWMYAESLEKALEIACSFNEADDYFCGDD
jgi:hypothetical protein